MRLVTCLILLLFFLNQNISAQLPCNTWLKVTSKPDAVEIGDLDVTGNKITVEAMFNRTTAYNPADDYRYAGDIVSKHMDPSDCNYLLRPRHAEITTTNGFFATPAVCDLELNKTYHVAFVYDGSTLKFYRNGFLLSQVPATGNLITNNYGTRIGDIAGPWNPPSTNFTGYINEVRIWNVARTQAQIKAGMNTTLANPTTQTGLLAYYTFNNLANKQGSGQWDGLLTGSGAINQTNPACTFVADSCGIIVSPVDNTCIKILQANYGGGGEDIAYDVVDAGNGQFFMVGNTKSFGAGGTDILVVKMDASKKVLWSNTYGVSGDETIRKASAAPSGGLLIAGQTNSFANAAGDILCMKIKTDGSVQWTRTFGVGSANGDLGSDIIQTADGGYAISGILNTAGFLADGLVIKLDANANQIWAKRFKTDIGEDGASIVESGNKLVATFDIERQVGLDYGMAISEIQTSNGQVLLTKRILSTAKGIFRPMIYKDFGTGYWISGHLIAESDYNQMEQVILHLNSNYDVIKTYKLAKNPLTNAFYTGFVPLASGGFVTCASEPLNMGAKGHIYRIANDGKVVFAKQVSTNGRSSLNALTISGAKIITVGSEEHNGNTDFYLADLDINGNNTDLCSIDTSIVSVQDYPFAVSNFSWTAVNDQNFTNTIQSVTISPQILASNTICSKDTCIVGPIILDFDIPDTVCVNTPVTITNKSVGAVSNFWSFCAADINAPPVAENLGNIGGAFRLPVFTDQIFYKGNYYVFVCNNYPGGLVRLDFGNSMLNTPTSVVLGNLGVLPNNLEGIQVVEDQGKWYAILVGGYPAGGTASRIMKVEFGTDPTNTSPVATNWGNIGNLDYPCDINVFKEADNWYGFTINSTNNTLTRFNFGTNFNAPPTAVNLGNLGNLDVPTGIFAIKEGANWSVFVTSNSDNSSITRLDFGTSLLNTPTAVNLGNIDNTLYRPRDIYLMRYCGKTVGFVVNGLSGHSDIVQLDFSNGITGIPTAKSLGNIGDLDFPHSISRLFRVGNDLYSFVTNVNNNTITRLKFEGCTNANIPNSSLFTPPAVTYSTPGIYNINLTINDTLATQTSLCKQVVVMPKPILDFSYQQDICNPYQLQFFGSDSSGNVVWDFGDGSAPDNKFNPVHLFGKAGTYKIKFSSDSRCPSSIEKSITINVANSNIIQNKDTVICEDGSVQLKADPAAEYCWTPSTYLSNPSISNPVAKPLKDITYYLGSKTIGNNVVVNGGFEAGNSGFSSSYNYASTNTTEGEYYVGSNPSAWNAALSSCADHTGNNGRMLLVNGAPQSDVEVWSQTIPVTPNTSFEFSTWVQALWPPNPAKLQFSINGIVLGEAITASLPTCTWSRFNTNWNSGSNTTATISIVNKNTEIQGNDFALDDISFAPITYKRDSVKITIDKPLIKSSNDTAVCAGSPVPLKTTGGASYTWSPSAGLSNAAIANPVAIINNTTQFIVTGTNANGCSAKDTVVVSILPPPILGITKDTAICGLGVVQLNASGATSYQWTPATGLSDATVANPSASPSVTTKYKVKATGDNGCAATDSVTVQVLPPLVINISNDTAVCNSSKVQLQASGANTYQWSPAASLSNPSIANPVASPSATTKYKVSASNGQCATVDSVTITILPSPTIVLSNDTAICKEGSALLKVSGGVSYNWSPSAGLSDISSANPTANPVITTKYKVLVTGANTCTATDSVVVSILPAPNLILSKDTMICGIGSVPLSSSGGVSYVWSPSIGLNNNLIANPVASPTITTSYHVQMTGSNACIANGTVVVKVLPALVTTVSNDTDVCVQNKAQLSATGGVKYQWTPAVGLSNALIANPLASPSVTTTYSVKITGADNCTATESVTISVLPLPVITLLSDTAICRNSSVELKASGGQTYQWSPATGLSNATISNPIATPASRTTYKLLVTAANNCTSSNSVTISIRPAAQFGIADDKLVGCESQPLQLQAFGGDKYVWSPAIGLSNAAIANPIAKLQTSQTYTVTISESVCKEQASFILPITIRPMLPLTVSKSNDITCNTPFAQLNANVLSANYNWSPSIGLSNTTIANPIANPVSATTYAITVEDSNGCVSTGTVSVKVYNNNDFRLYQMPNAFTPDRNGNNDCFGVAKWGTVRIVYFEIYNRWGQLVFSGNNSRSCWDGSLNGQPQPSGNFVYRIKVETMCGVVEKQGSVVLIR